MQEDEKKVDEFWKEQVKKEKEGRKGREASERSERRSTPPIEANFSHFLSTLALQAAMAMDEGVDPQTSEKIVPDLQQAKYMIDLLSLLQEKTKGNLTVQEETLLTRFLSELRLKYVKKTSK